VENKKNISIIGYGNQARAWALNLKDSGYKVTIGLRSGSPSKNLATAKGFSVFDYESEPIESEICVILTPDNTHIQILERIKNPNCLFVFAHGFSVTAGNLKTLFPKTKFALLAPKAIASELRFRFETNQSLAAFYSLEFCDPKDEKSIKDLAEAIGIRNLYPTTFQEETQADLFSEQALLCSVLPYTINLAFQTLIERGYKKELAFYECFVEAKLIVDALLKVGPEAFFDFISPNALIGSEKGRLELIDNDFKQKFQKLLNDVQDPKHLQDLSSADVLNTKKSVNEFWKGQSLNKVYQELKETL
tara:strand:+ start:1223 stop:2137 length:915 start_codon:yes stop_codon:yes gene_type:complete